MDDPDDLDGNVYHFRARPGTRATIKPLRGLRREGTFAVRFEYPMATAVGQSFDRFLEVAVKSRPPAFRPREADHLRLLPGGRA
jgi:hypothetical protein